MSGLNSYMGSNDGSLSALDGAKGVGPRSLQEKIQMAKAQRAQDKKLSVKGSSPAKEINKQKKARKASVAGIAASIKGLQEGLLLACGNKAEGGDADDANGAAEEEMEDQDKHGAGQLGDLTGAREALSG